MHYIKGVLFFMDAVHFTNKLVELTRDISLEVSTVFLPILNKYDLTLIQLQILRGIRDNDNLLDIS